MKAYYETMVFEHTPGHFTANVTISTAKSYWTSPETALEATNWEDARVEAREKVCALRHACEDV
jgi:hypothetical protein